MLVRGVLSFQYLYIADVIKPTCKLCNQAEETVSYLLICCKTLEYLRAPTVNNIIKESSKLFALHCTINTQLDIIQLIINPFHYAVNTSLEANICTSIEPLCRKLCKLRHISLIGVIKHNVIISQLSIQSNTNVFTRHMLFT
jgi:hypothetical protein